MNAAVPRSSALPAARAHHGESAGRGRASVGDLTQSVDPLAPGTPILSVGERFLDASSAAWLSLPIVEAGRPVGSISRYELMQRVYIRPFGRELHGKRPVATIMHLQPLVLPGSQSVEAAGAIIAARIRRPIMEDFCVVDDAGAYIGAGKVLDVLAAMETRLGLRSAELEQAYRTLQSSQAQLIQSEKMASLGQMVAGIAHEINTPLGYVGNNVEMTRASLADIRTLVRAYGEVVDGMLEGVAPQEFARRVEVLEAHRSVFDSAAIEDLAGLLDDTVFGVAQIADLVGNLKDFSRLDQTLSDRVDIHKLIEGALKVGGSVLRKKNIEIVRRFGNVPPLDCAPAQINQVLLNLITNAAQAIEHGAGRITLRTHAAGRHVLILVEDNGKGIAPEHLQRIFDPFFTTKAVGQGTGLGLSICYQIVERHRGQIRVTSTPGAGSRFLVALPLAGPAQPAERMQ